jgi:hypothetical protein
MLGATFLKGFKEALGIAVILVASYLSLNAIVTVRALYEVLHHPHLVAGWKNTIFAQHPNWLGIAGVCLLLFPRLDIALSFLWQRTLAPMEPRLRGKALHPIFLFHGRL